MALDPVEISLELIDRKVKFLGTSTTNPDRPIQFDYTPPLGTGDGYAGIEMLTMSFAGCVSTAVVGLLKRRGKNVRSYEMRIKGIKHEEPLFLEAIEFTCVISADDTSEDDMRQILAIAEQISPAWIAIRGNVKVTGGFLLNQN